MPRYALKVEYHGSPFVGWQRQTGLASVQGTLEAALAKLEPRAHKIAAAGRTDAGVHATAQVAHCDMDRDWGAYRLSEALNYHLKPAPVAIIACAEVSDRWHARFSAIQRQYHFRLLMRRAPATHHKGLVWQVKHALDHEAMQRAADRLLGEHDFTTFRSTVCQADSPVKTLDRLRVRRVEMPHGPEIHFDVAARSFLHNQVRSFVGTLERVGAGAMTADDVSAALAARDRAACGPVCPPQGLYLAGVRYAMDPFSSECAAPTPALRR